MTAEPDPPTRYDPAYPSEEVVHERTEDSYAGRVRAVRVVNSVIRFVTALFAVVLAIHIVLVLAEANPDNGFAEFISGFAGAVSLGFDGLFNPDSEKAAVLFNYGAAAIVWLLIGTALVYLVRKFAMPGPNRTVSYRRTVR
ncbi:MULTISPECIES: hypothetical protein [Actinokineospora]|uniref:YggT family protein n=1 Tax=Actinokineospora fastidiosa TaxID=1816 RepID=A0A918GAQ9_9PSEU|nr:MULTISPECIES: hypothetical protein [Actinokineospora]UVS81616.1 hypothetical protein Actkin_05378 [Actinokineospora sp. UTMC 2448]GGS26409.1 hypothetical protein GCM10010171_19890 [Actinokineospora fastidiosa]